MLFQLSSPGEHTDLHSHRPHMSQAEATGQVEEVSGSSEKPVTHGRWCETLSHYTRDQYVGTHAEGINTVKSGAGTRGLERSQRVSGTAQRICG